MRYMAKLSAATAVTAAAFASMTGVAGAHPHTVNGHPIANAQNHAPFTADGDSCGGDPAAYGLETAHHGPDDEAGRADGCYSTTVVRNAANTAWVPAASTNPRIR